VDIAIQKHIKNDWKNIGALNDMNYEITITEREIIVSTIHYSKRTYEYNSYEFSRMNDRYSDAPQVFVIHTSDGRVIKYNVSNISSIEINK
jgi:hypothetical protein